MKKNIWNIINRERYYRPDLFEKFVKNKIWMIQNENMTTDNYEHRL